MTVVGAVPGLAITAWLLTQGRLQLLGWTPSGNFYDAQAHSLLDGHLAVDPAVLRHDGFVGRHGTYLYQGPVPALLRIPVIAVFGDRYDGRLGQLSMLVAFAAILVVAARLHWRVRTLLRGPVAVGVTEAALVALFAFALAAGSALTFLASRAWVFHEAVAWGIAFALAAIDQLVALVRRPSGWALARASAFTAAALLTRASIGLGPLAGLVLVGVGVVAARVGGRLSHALGWLGPASRGRRLPIALFALAAAVPLAAYAVVNWAKFGTLFSVPFSNQVLTHVDPGHRAFLDANGGTFFGLQFVPTTVLHYLRPDGVAFSATFPFVGFRAPPGTVVGGAVFDLVDRAASVPASMPFLLVLAITGVVLAFRARAWHDLRFQPLRTPTLAALLGGLTVFPFGYVAERYLGDFVPFLVLAGLVGLQGLLATHRRRRPARSRAGVAAALVALAAFGVWVNVALALEYQRLWAPVAPPELVAGFVGFQHDVAAALGTGDVTVQRGDALPDGTGRAGSLFVVGDCDGLYLSDGLGTNAVKRSPWIPVELGPDRHLVADVRLERMPPGTVVPIASVGDDRVVARWVDGDHVAFAYRPAGGAAFEDVPVRVEPGRRYRLDLRVDDRVEELSMRLDDARVLSTFRTDPVGAIRLAAAFAGEARRRSVSTPLCEELLGSRRA
ncbi:MAG: hypothetical protein ACHQIG_02135 [Acidimicrobiia bacterium]